MYGLNASPTIQPNYHDATESDPFLHDPGACKPAMPCIFGQRDPASHPTIRNKLTNTEIIPEFIIEGTVDLDPYQTTHSIRGVGITLRVT